MSRIWLVLIDCLFIIIFTHFLNLCFAPTNLLLALQNKASLFHLHFYQHLIVFYSYWKLKYLKITNIAAHLNNVKLIVQHCYKAYGI